MSEAPPRLIADQIRRGLAQFTPTERKVARVLLANYPMPGLQTVALFARQVGVSNPSILRFIAKLGFSVYADFQQALRAELEIRLHSPLTRSQPEIAADDDFLDHFRDSVTQALSVSLTRIDRAEFETAVALLADHRRPVLIAGGRFTDSVALQMTLTLRVIRPSVDHLTGQTGNWPDILLDVGKHHVLVVFDIRRYQDDLVAFALEAARLGAEIILFTDAFLSPIAAVAQHVFAIESEVASNWNSYAALGTLVEAMVARLSGRDWRQVKERVARLESIRTQLAARSSP